MTQRLSTTRSHQAVTFSQYSGMVLIPKVETRSSKLWYSSRDYHQFQRALIDDARRLSRELGGTNRAPQHHFLFHECLGIEVYLSQDLVRMVQEARHSHVHAVLQEQRLQYEHGIHDIEKLSSVSRKSVWSQERAHDRAIGYWLQQE